MNVFRFLALLSVLSACYPCAAALRSQKNPLQLRFGKDPQVAVFTPGNMGLAALCTTAPQQIGNLGYNEEALTNAEVVDLYDAAYNYAPFSADAESTRPAGYWMRLAGQIGYFAQFGKMTDCRVTTSLIHQLQQDGKTIGDLATRIGSITSDGIPPLFSFDLHDAVLAGKLRDEWRSHNALPLLGLVCRSSSDLDHATGWDFVIVSDRVLPLDYSQQSAIQYLRARAGQIPVIMLCEKPHLYRELFWLASGAAAIQYDGDLPPFSSPDNRTAWRNLRALCSLSLRIGADVRPAPELTSRNVLGAIVSQQRNLCLVLAREANFELPLPAATATYPDYFGTWYNPVTDESILSPRLKNPGRKLHLKSPSADPWMYLHNYLPPATDRDSTMTLILPEPPEPEEPDDVTSGAALNQAPAERRTPGM